MAAIENLLAATPTEIDTVLSEIWGRQAKVRDQIAKYKRFESEILKKIEKIKKGERVLGVSTVLHGIELMENLALAGRHLVAEGDKLALLEIEALPYETEYTRRGGWSRYFLVANDNGHIHRSMGCQTCNREGQATQFTWLVDYSGKAEKDLTDEVGPTACTVCFPWAETIRVEHEAQVRADKAAAREAAAAEKARVAAEKGILTPEGRPLDLGRHGYRDIAGSLRTAEIFATDALYDLIRAQQHAEDPEWAWHYENGRTAEKEQADITHLAWWAIRAIAAKKGQTFEETFQVHEKKAQAKIRKADREWAKDPRNPNRTK